jgi:hypothetical protein
MPRSSSSFISRLLFALLSLVQRLLSNMPPSSLCAATLGPNKGFSWVVFYCLMLISITDWAGNPRRRGNLGLPAPGNQQQPTKSSWRVTPEATSSQDSWACKPQVHSAARRPPKSSGEWPGVETVVTMKDCRVLRRREAARQRAPVPGWVPENYYQKAYYQNLLYQIYYRKPQLNLAGLGS